ncbi:DgyrCDS6844 [Dimorphilus gyrociliatus]|uniref:DgyrCDS6844 n=1 Tax=Dimorphilus gyrociliatus TaxID=2664684 RepID=A0A7I8VQT9_9ANNE|nr:DgyrCDS6844 [Dimorphilus gyrociliatus]
MQLEYKDIWSDNLLREIFNKTPKEEKPLTSLPPQCNNPVRRCNQCLDVGLGNCRRNTKGRGRPNQECCATDDYIGCYTLKDCKEAVKPECTNAPINCITGSAYTFTLQPAFEADFRTGTRNYHVKCHIKSKEPEILYKLFYEIEVESLNYRSERRYKEIKSKGLDFLTHGSYTTDFLTVKHTTNLKMEKDFILDIYNDPTGKPISYKLFPYKKKVKKNRPFKIEKMPTDNSFLTYVQFEEPFAYSTSKWFSGRNSDSCNKNTSKFIPYYTGDLGDEKDYIDVNVTIKSHSESQIDKPFEYDIKRNNPLPSVKFIMPGNQSLFKWYFKNGPHLIVDETLKASLTLTRDEAIWVINITGRMSDCPGYMQVRVNDRKKRANSRRGGGPEELYKIDLLVGCAPKPTFNISFSVPNFMYLKSRTYDVQLEDPYKNYSIFLTRMVIEHPKYIAKREKVTLKEPDMPHLVALIILSSVCGVLALLSVSVFCYLDCTRKNPKGPSTRIPSADTHSIDSSSTSCGHWNGLSKSQILIIVTYGVFKMLYTFIFTFTVLYTVLSYILSSDFKGVEAAFRNQTNRGNETRRRVLKIDEFGENELIQQVKLVTSMQSSCSVYVEELFDSLRKDVDKKSNDPTISHLMRSHIDYAMYAYSKNVTEFSELYKEELNNHLSKTFFRYRQYLKKIYHSNWTKTAADLFNKSRYSNERPKAFRKNEYLRGKEVDFASFLNIEEVQNAQLWPLQFWQMFNKSLPVRKRLPLPKFNKCPGPGGSKTPRHQLDSVRFFSEKLPKKSMKGMNSNGYEYKFVVPNEGESYLDKETISLNELKDSLHLGTLKIVFFVMDLFIILYRLTRTVLYLKSMCKGFEVTERLSTFPEKTNENVDDRYKQIDIPAHSVALNSAPKKPPRRKIRWRSKTAKMIQHPLLPKILIAIALLTLIHFAVRSTRPLFTAEFFDHTEVLTASLRVRANETNNYIKQQAVHFNNVTLPVFEEQARNELVHLQTFLSFFNGEKRRRSQNYLKEACAIRKKSLHEEDPCDIQVDETILDIQIIPCKFIPIRPKFYSGLLKDKYASSVSNDISEIASGLLRMAVVCGHVLCALIASMLLSHLLGTISFKFFKSRRIFSVKLIYIVSNPPTATTKKRNVDDTDYETDEDLVRVPSKGRGRHVHVRMAPDGSTAKPETLLSDFSYSETKV